MITKNSFEFVGTIFPLKFSIEVTLIRNFLKFRSFRKKFWENLKIIFFYFIENFSTNKKKNLLIRLLIGYVFKKKKKNSHQRPIFSQINGWVLLTYIQVLMLYFITKEFMPKKCFKRFFNFKLLSRGKNRSILKNSFVRKFKTFVIIKNKLNHIFLEKHLGENVSSVKIKIIFNFSKKKNLGSELKYLEFRNKKQKLNLIFKSKQRKYLITKDFFLDVKKPYRKIMGVKFLFYGIYNKLKLDAHTETLLFFITKKTKFKHKKTIKNFLFPLELFYHISYTKIIEMLIFLSEKVFSGFLNVNFFQSKKIFPSKAVKPKIINFLSLKNFLLEINLDFLFHLNASRLEINQSMDEFNCCLKFCNFIIFKKILKKTNSLINLLKPKVKSIEVLKNLSGTKRILYNFSCIETILGSFARQMIIKIFKEFNSSSLFWKKLQTNFYSGYILETVNLKNKNFTKVGCEKNKIFIFWQKTLFLIMNYFIAGGIKNFHEEIDLFFLNDLLEKKIKNIFSIFKLNFLQIFNEQNFLKCFFLKKLSNSKNLLKLMKSKFWLFYENFVTKKNSRILFLKIRLSILAINKNILFSNNFF